MLTLYNYFRSSASYRVRIALNLKKINYQYNAVHLLKEGGQQFTDEYQKLSPQSLVPTLKNDDFILNQSLAIIEYLNDKYPDPPLLPNNCEAKAFVRSIAYAICCDIHPLNNLRVLKFLKHPLNVTEDQKNEWIAHWIELGFQSLELQLTQSKKSGLCCFDDIPTLADVALIPQIQNAHRFNISMNKYPKLSAIEKHCLTLPAFIQAHPNNQPDKEE